MRGSPGSDAHERKGAGAFSRALHSNGEVAAAESAGDGVARGGGSSARGGGSRGSWRCHVRWPATGPERRRAALCAAAEEVGRRKEKGALFAISEIPGTQL